MNPGLASLLLLGLFAEQGPPPQKQANCIWLSTWMKAARFWKSRQATGRSVIRWREYMRISVCADAILWCTRQMEVPLLVSCCSVFVSTYSGSWLWCLGRFSWEVTASCSPFPACPCLSVGAHLRARVAEIGHCQVFCHCRSQRGMWYLKPLQLNPAGLAHLVLVQAAGFLTPGHLGLNSHALHLHHMLLNLMSTDSKVYGRDEEKYLLYDFTSKFRKCLQVPTGNIICLLQLFFFVMKNLLEKGILCVHMFVCLCLYSLYMPPFLG